MSYWITEVNCSGGRENGLPVKRGGDSGKVGGSGIGDVVIYIFCGVGGTYEFTFLTYSRTALCYSFA